MRFEFGHPAELFDDVWCVMGRVETAVNRVDVHRNSPVFAEFTETRRDFEEPGNIAGRFERIDACIMAAGGFGIDERKVVANVEDPGPIGDWTVTRHDCVHVHGEH